MPILAILTSGGDAPGMNAVIRAAAKTASAHGWRVIGVEDGYNGLIEGRFVDLTPAFVDDIDREGGTVLRSARSAKFRTVEGRAQAARHLTGVDCLLVIGGNGSLTGAKIFLKEHGIRVVGVPASIDNDIACTSMSIGVDTALNTIVEACDHNLRYGSFPSKSFFGRGDGKRVWLSCNGISDCMFCRRSLVS